MLSTPLVLLRLLDNSRLVLKPRLCTPNRSGRGEGEKGLTGAGMDWWKVVVSAPEHTIKSTEAAGAPTVLARSVDQLGRSRHFRHTLKNKGRQRVALG